MKFDLPFTPIRPNLYSPSELYHGLSRNAGSFLTTPDFAIYSFWVKSGRSRPTDFLTPMMQALHDNSITQALLEFVADKQVVAIMGGHDLSRNDPDYAKIVQIAREFTKSGRLVMSGGGPRAMEAAHFGSWFAHAKKKNLSAALERMSKSRPFPPRAGNVVAPDGTVDAKVADALFEWLRLALTVKEDLTDKPGDSLGVPTWQYGHEPATPFASSIAKYFENSVREDGSGPHRQCRDRLRTGQRGNDSGDFSGCLRQFL